MRAAAEDSRAGRRRPGGAWPWLVPALAMIGLFYGLPMLDALRLAFTDASLVSREVSYTLASLGAVFSDPALGVVLRNTLVFALAAVVLQVSLGLAIALLVARGERARLPGMLVLRTIVLAAWVVPGVANGLIWKMLFSEAPFGAINSALRLVGLMPVAWLSNPSIAMVSVVITATWQGTAFAMIVLYAARKGIDPALYEAASVDGGSAFSQLCNITLPQLGTVLIVTAVLVTIQMLNAFDAILALTGGGPGRATEVLSLFTYRTVFANHDLARGSALAILLLVVTLALSVVYMLLLRRREAAQ